MSIMVSGTRAPKINNQEGVWLRHLVRQPL